MVRLSPDCLAKERVDRCMASAGIDSSVRDNTRSTSSSPSLRGESGRGVVEQTVDALLHTALSPLTPGMRLVDTRRATARVVEPIGGQRDHPRSQDQRLHCLQPPAPEQKLLQVAFRSPAAINNGASLSLTFGIGIPPPLSDAAIEGITLAQVQRAFGHCDGVAGPKSRSNLRQT